MVEGDVVLLLEGLVDEEVVQAVAAEAVEVYEVQFKKGGHLTPFLFWESEEGKRASEKRGHLTPFLWASEKGGHLSPFLL